MKENKLLALSRDFAVSSIQLSSSLKKIGQNAIADQLQRSATSISANIAEANHPQSRADMISKFEISLKESNETENWLVICHESGFLDNETFKNLHKQIVQIKILLISSVKTLKGKN